MPRRRPDKLSDQLRQAIATCGKTQYRIAKDTDIDPATLCRFMQGRHGLAMETVDRLGEYLELRLVGESKSEKTKGK